MLLNNLLTSSDQNQIGSYLNQVQELTVKDTNTLIAPKIISDNITYSLLFSPLFIYGSIVLFFLIFLGGIAIQIIYRITSLKKIVTTLIIAFVIGSIPITVRTALEVTSLHTRASPDEIPKYIVIVKDSPRSYIVSWETDIAKVGSVRYGKAPLVEASSKIVIADIGKKTLRHRAKIQNLDIGAEYEFEILSGSKWYNDHGNPLKLPVL